MKIITHHFKHLSERGPHNLRRTLLSTPNYPWKERERARGIASLGPKYHSRTLASTQPERALPEGIHTEKGMQYKLV